MTRFIPYGSEVGDRDFDISSITSFDLDDNFDVPVVLFRQNLQRVFVSIVLNFE